MLFHYFIKMAGDFEDKLEKLTNILSRRIRNKETNKGLIMASYDDSSLKGNVDDLVLKQVEKERRAGNFYINHLILRDSKAEIDNLKFLYLIDGVPAIVYVLMNLTKSGLEKIAVVGSRDIKTVIEAFIELYKPKQKIIFEDEGKELSLENTLSKGRSILKPSHELVYISPADVPFLYDISKIIRNRKHRKYEAVLNLNTKEKVGKYFPRNFHLRVGRFDVKEPNIFLVDLNKLPYNLIGIAYSDYRKFYSEHKDKKVPIRKEEIEDIIREYWKEPAILRVIPKLVSKFPGVNWQIRLVSFLIEQYTRFDKGIPRISLSSFQDILCLLSDMKIKVLKTNNDPATLEDLDSYEDWCYMNEMMKAGTSFYPHYDEIQRFKEIMPELKKNIPLLENFEEYINHIFKKFGLFKKQYYKDKSPFLLRQPYDAEGELDMEFAKQGVIDMIKNNLIFHKHYLARYKARQLFRKEYK